MKSASAILIALALSACASTPTRFYTLQPDPAQTGALQPFNGRAVRIDAVHIPADLDRPELVRDEGGDRFTVSDNDHWAAPVGELLRRVLTQDLAAQLPPDRVIFPDSPKLSGSDGLVVDILSIRSSPAQVVMMASWTVTPPAGGAAPHQRTLRLTVPSAGAGVRGDASELSALAGRLAEAIAKDLAGQT